MLRLPPLLRHTTLLRALCLHHVLRLTISHVPLSTHKTLNVNQVWCSDLDIFPRRLLYRPATPSILKSIVPGAALLFSFSFSFSFLFFAPFSFSVECSPFLSSTILSAFEGCSTVAAARPFFFALVSARCLHLLCRPLKHRSSWGLLLPRCDTTALAPAAILLHLVAAHIGVRR